jgi:hypothetical protein
MRIGIIAWGSVVWRPEHLPFSDSDPEWHDNGPELPLEFSRISKDARLTLVLDSTGTPVPTLHRKSSRSCLIDAASDLKEREGTLMKHIGFITADGKINSFTEYSKQLHIHDRMLTWLTTQKERYDAAVWTALPPNFSDQRTAFTNDAATDYLLALPEIVRKHALEYIQKAPVQIATAFRQHLSEKKIIQTPQAD